MNKAAAPTFGKNIDKLLTPIVDPDGDVEIGELQILGSQQKLRDFNSNLRSSRNTRLEMLLRIFLKGIIAEQLFTPTVAQLL